MDKAELFDTLINLQKELMRPMRKELLSTNHAEKITEYNRRLQQIQNEIDRIKKGISYTRK